MAGRKTKPTALKKLEGNPGKRKLNTKEPVPGKGIPDCPKWLLSEVKKEWERAETHFEPKHNRTDGSEISMSDYKGKVLLIVNTATGCGFTPQYSELQEIYETYKDRGFEILDFPCNQFGEQAPGEDAEIYSFCTGRYGITFPQFSKVDVNGDHAVPLFKWMTEHTKFEGFGMAPMGVMLSGIAKKMDKDYKNNGNIKWNFTKFLIDRNGEIVARFEPTNMKNLKEKIEECLQ